MNRRELARRAAGAKTAATPPELDASGVENVSKKLQVQLERGDFYGALQMYKTLFMRHLKGEPDEAQQQHAVDLALDAALHLMQHDQNTAALEMANLMVSVFVEHHWKVEASTKDRVRKIHDAFVAKPQFLADLGVFLKNAVKWSGREGARKRGDPELQLLLARVLAQTGDFQGATKHFLHSECPIDFANMLFEWSKQGYPSESDLYVARAVLQLLCLENLRDANAVYEQYVTRCKQASRNVDLPLFHFSRFLLLTLERDAAPLFQVLQERYAAGLSRDPSLKEYMLTIGHKFYGIQPPRTGLSSLLDMFSGGMQ